MEPSLPVLVRNINKEIICDFEVPEKMKKVWNVELNCLEIFKSICEKYNLKYYAINGTLLGAVRHEGFIPWDDDIDVGMPRKDYETFLIVAEKEIMLPYYLQTYKSERSFTMDMAKLRNSNTTGFTKTEALNDTNKGIFIDIFPIDNVPDDTVVRENDDKKHRFQMHLVSAVSKKANYKGFFGQIINVIRKIASMLVYQSVKERLLNKIIKDIKKYNDTQTVYCGMRSFWAKNPFIWRVEDCQEVKEIPFEKTLIAVPIGFDRILTEIYGDYHKFVKAGSYHEGTIFEPDIPFEQYFERR